MLLIFAAWSSWQTNQKKIQNIHIKITNYKLTSNQLQKEKKTHIADGLEELSSEVLEGLFLIFGLSRNDSVEVIAKV